MNVLAINNRFPPESWFGAEKQVFARLQWFKDELNWNVSVITTTINTPPITLEYKGIRVYQIKKLKNRATLKNQKIFNVIAWVFDDFFDFRTFLHTRRILKIQKPDVVWVRNLSQLSLSVLLATKLFKIKTCITPADHWWLCFLNKPLNTCEGFNKAQCGQCLWENGQIRVSKHLILFTNIFLFFLRKISWFVFKRFFDLIIFNSNYTRNEYITNIGMLKNQTVIYNPAIIKVASKIDDDVALLKKLKEKIVLYVGSLNAEKGVEIAIKAMHKVFRRIPNAILIVVGEGPEKKNLIRICQKLNIENNVLFTGLITDLEKLSCYYQIADVVLVPSIRPETLGAIVLEAYAHGKPVVVSAAGGALTEIVVNGKNGYIAQPNPEDFSEKILSILEHDSEKYYEVNLKEYNEKYNMKKISLMYKQLFQNL